ncbi:MAG: patatin family protein [Clostridiales bacterium]|nr:patatin family protein [Clostridiales bacterium]
MKTGLVLEGGAMRGLFSAGVTDVLMEEGITFDGAIGVSAGAAFGCNVKSRQIGRALRYNTAYCNDPRYCSFRSLLKTGDLYGAEFCYSTIPYELDPFDVETYNQNPMNFYVVCTDVETGEAVYHNCPESNAESMQWFRASASMPLVSRIVEVGGYRLLDGGIADSIPLEAFEKLGYNHNLVILTQPEGYVKKPNKAMPLMRLALGKYPKLLNTIANRHIIYNQQVAYAESRQANGAALILRPEAPLDMSRTEHDAEKLRAAYHHGQEVARKNLDQIRVFLDQPVRKE